MTNERTIVSPLSPADTNEEIVKDRVIERALERMLLFGNDVKKKILQNFCKLPKWLPLLSSLDNETEIFKKVQYNSQNLDV